jgi:hypothetical protein
MQANDIALRWARLLLAAAVLALSGCAFMVPQTVALRTDWPAGVPERVELADVPFFPQADYQCGPASLATVLVHSGVAVHADALVDQVWLPARRGSLQLEMLATPRRHGRVSYRLAPRYADLLREVAAGHPVVVLQDVGMMLPEWHYAVVNGYDYGTGTIFLRSGTEPREQMPFTAFERSWMKGGYWAMVVLPPGQVAATATEDRWLEALSALARGGDVGATVQAYAAALQRWPANLAAAIGLANHLHQRGSLGEAAEVLRGALQRHPDSAIVLNNLAQTLSDLGRHAEALALIARANDPQSPFAAEVRATRLQIEQRMHASPK